MPKQLIDCLDEHKKKYNFDRFKKQKIKNRTKIVPQKKKSANLADFLRFGGERGIRTPGTALTVHPRSRRAPSTAQTSLHCV